MSKLSDLFSDAAKNCSELAADLSAIAVELGANPIVPPVVPPVIPPVIPPVTPPAGVQFQLIPGSNPQKYTEAVGVFSFIAANVGYPGTSIVTACWDFSRFPGTKTKMEVFETLGGQVLTSTAEDNPNSQCQLYTGNSCAPGQLYYLVITREQAGGVMVNQTNK